MFSVGEKSNSLWHGHGAFSLCRLFTCTKMLHNTIKERQKLKKHNVTSLKLVSSVINPNSWLARIQRDSVGAHSRGKRREGVRGQSIITSVEKQPEFFPVLLCEFRIHFDKFRVYHWKRGRLTKMVQWVHIKFEWSVFYEFNKAIKRILVWWKRKMNSGGVWLYCLFNEGKGCENNFLFADFRVFLFVWLLH